MAASVPWNVPRDSEGMTLSREVYGPCACIDFSVTAGLSFCLAAEGEFSLRVLAAPTLCLGVGWRKSLVALQVRSGLWSHFLSLSPIMASWDI